MSAQCIFPAELISQIFYHTDPQDIVRWRTVSRWFRTLTYDPVLWKNLYADVPFPRPPGPFPSQSFASLERNLVKSAQLAQSWTTRPMRDVSCVRIKLKGEQTGMRKPPKLIHGRWFVAYEPDPERFVLYDADSEADAPRVLWEQDKPKASSFRWDVCSMTSVEGQCIVYVLLGLPVESRPFSNLLKLFEFRLNDESGELVDSAAMDGPAYAPASFGYGMDSEGLHAGKSPFLCIPTFPQRVFDTRARVFYEFPDIHVALDDDVVLEDTRIAFTNTYIVYLNHFYSSSGHQTVIEVFTLPPDGSTVKNGNHVLCLTHETVLDDVQLVNVEALKPLVDPVTGATHLRLLDYTDPRRDLQITRVDLILPEPRADEVSPMTVEMRNYKLLKEGELTSRHETCFQYVDASEEGHVRGFYGVMVPFGDALENDHVRVVKFAVDTRQDEWVINCGELSPVKWSRLGDMVLNESIMFDGMRGKICSSDLTNQNNIVIVDIE